MIFTSWRGLFDRSKCLCEGTGSRALLLWQEKPSTIWASSFMLFLFFFLFFYFSLNQLWAKQKRWEKDLADLQSSSAGDVFKMTASYFWPHSLLPLSPCKSCKASRIYGGGELRRHTEWAKQTEVYMVAKTTAGKQPTVLWRAAVMSFWREQKREGEATWMNIAAVINAQRR